MKTLFAVLLITGATLVQAQSLENDLDGNASALQASEMKPRQQTARRPAQVASRPNPAKAKRQRVAAR
jgi:hypothetical protein